MQSLALFPLKIILFPGVSLDLQIFEQRYLKLISHCMKSDEPFGIVGIKSGNEVGDSPELYDIGTSVSIQDWQQLANGLLGISVLGQQRFRILATEQDDDQLVRAQIEWLPHEHDGPLSENYQGLKDLLLDLSRHPGAETFRLNPETQNLASLGWQLSQVLPLDDLQKMELLEMTEPVKRIEKLVDWVEELSRR